jgi:rubrerythrin
VPVLEKAVVYRIMGALRTVPGLVVRKRHGTVMGLAGDPDLYGAYRGAHFEFEVKRPNEPASQVTKLQAERLAEWRRAGAVVGVVRCVEDAMVLLGLQPRQQAVWICAACRKYHWTSADAPARCPMCGGTRFEQEAA